MTPAELLDAISADDRDWFATHPDERFRYRLARPVETSDPRRWPELVPLVVAPPLISPRLRATPICEVEQLAPGVRRRRFFWEISERPRRHGMRRVRP